VSRGNGGAEMGRVDGVVRGEETISSDGLCWLRCLERRRGDDREADDWDVPIM
jgi:hypothetical protein